jgi:hypothetical protein
LRRLLNHASGRAVWDVIFTIAESAGFVVILAGRACLPRAAMSSHLPPELAADAVVVSSGAALLRVVESA